MNVKSYKFYKGIFELAAKDYINDAGAVKVFFKNTLDFDYDVAAELWDYLVTDAVAAKIPRAAAAALGDPVLDLFLKRNALKTYRLITGCEAVTNVLYAMPDILGDVARGALIYFLTGQKYAEADIVFRAMQKGASYGAAMKDLAEKYFAEIKKKSGSVKVTMPKKTAEFLLLNVAKIKTNERALLEQRIKETIR